MIQVCMSRLLFLCLSFIHGTVFADIQTIKIAYISQEKNIPSALSNLDDFIQHKGLAGVEIAITDNNTTGQFTGQNYQLKKILVTQSENVVDAFNQQVSDDINLVVSNLSAKQLQQLLAHDKAKKILFFDAATVDDNLRTHNCDINVLHMRPSRAMKADALAQYMMKKRWNNWFLVTGMTEADQAYAKALKRAAMRFGMTLVEEKQWTHTFDARRTAQSDVPVFTQGIDYDVLVVADEQGLFGEYLGYRMWDPRPVIGTQGLIATSWHRTHEQWGAVQIQNRFRKVTGRWMEEQDYAAYLAIRSIGEASVRTKSEKMQVIKDYLLGDKFALQGYKGNPLSFRPWNGQLRQPVLLAAARSLVAVAPIEGFLHPKTELDTLGVDLGESFCGDKPIEKHRVAVVEAKENTDSWFNRLKRFIQQLMNKFKQ